MSVNGDLTIYRNGKSKSQISIYDYPEHLNPFYEDENHKRLRFWKFGKNKNGSGKESRRGSFSIDGFKEMWAFKSFRLKKKSSTLGINKTSESPPILRRDIVADTSQSNYGTYDPRMRHTTELSAFQRNVPYRNSIQDMRLTTPVKNGIGFNRNDEYRNTIQTPTRMGRSPSTNLQRRYVYGGSQTPQPNRSNISGYYDDSNDIRRGSSQLSVASSTNPFDDDDDVIIGEFEHNTSNGDTPMKRIRKKRRAPPPPIAISKVIEEENSNLSPVQKNQNASQNETDINLTNLSAEIQNFVKISATDNDIKENDNNYLPVKLRIEEDTDEIKSDTKILTKNNTLIINNKETIEINNNEKPNNCKSIILESDPKTKLKNADTLELKMSNITNESINDDLKINNIQNDTQIMHNQNNVISETDDEKISNIRKTNESEVEQTRKNSNKSRKIIITKAEINNQSESIPEDNFILEKSIKIENFKEDSPPSEDKISNFRLKITESKEDLSSLEDNCTKSETPSGIKTEIRYIPLKESSPAISDDIQRYKRPPSPPPVPPLITKSNTIEKFDETVQDLPPQKLERRRSVREIIASINRSQSLLKVNKDINNKNSDENNFDTPNHKSKYNYEIRNYENNSQNGIKKSEALNNLDSLKNSDNNNVNEDQDVKDVEREFAGIIENLSNHLNNVKNDPEIFKKCSPQRESSPTTSNLDWNPVPKPKRTKKLSPILNSNGSNRESPVKFNERIIE